MKNLFAILSVLVSLSTFAGDKFPVRYTNQHNVNADETFAWTSMRIPLMEYANCSNRQLTNMPIFHSEEHALPVVNIRTDAKSGRRTLLMMRNQNIGENSTKLELIIGLETDGSVRRVIERSCTYRPEVCRVVRDCTTVSERNRIAEDNSDRGERLARRGNAVAGAAGSALRGARGL